MCSLHCTTKCPSLVKLCLPQTLFLNWNCELVFWVLMSQLQPFNFFKVYLVFTLNVWLLGMSAHWNRAHYSLEHVHEVTYSFVGCCELPGGLWVPYDQVCIRAFSNSPFSRIKVEDFCCVSTGDSYKSVFVHFSAVLGKIKTQIVSYFCDRCTSHPRMRKLKVSTTYR